MNFICGNGLVNQNKVNISDDTLNRNFNHRKQLKLI